MEKTPPKYGDLIEKIYLALHNRQVGNTTLMTMGTDSYTKPFFVIAHTKAYALQIAKKNVNAKGITLSELAEMDGWVAPVAVDHHLLETSLRHALMDFDFLEMESKVLRSSNERLTIKCNELVKKYNRLNKLFFDSQIKPGQLRRLCRIFNEEFRKKP